jgi:hypothetical protein
MIGMLAVALVDDVPQGLEEFSMSVLLLSLLRLFLAFCDEFWRMRGLKVERETGEE